MKWTFSIIENIFEKLRNEERLKTPSYMLFGHSAGAQFVHRFVLMMDKPHLSVAVAANAGAYLLPAYPSSIFDFRFPWMLDQHRIDNNQLKDAFSRKLIVLLGEEDIRTNASEFPRSREAMAQGATRFERGRNFYAKAKVEAEKLGGNLQWQLLTVPGVGHNSRKMTKAAATILFSSESAGQSR